MTADSVTRGPKAIFLSVVPTHMTEVCDSPAEEGFLAKVLVSRLSSLLLKEAVISGFSLCEKVASVLTEAFLPVIFILVVVLVAATITVIES